MANTLLTITDITREALRLLHNNLTFARSVNKQYDDQFAVAGAKIGDTLRIRLPNRYTVRTGAALSAQDTTERVVSLVVATQKGVDIQFTSSELTLKLDDFSSRILKPAMARIASQIDFDGLTEFQNIYNQVGTPGTTPATAKVFLDGGALMDDYATPRDGLRYSCVNPDACAAIVDGLKGLFQDSGKISEQYRNGMMGQGLGFMWGMDQNINRHTVGVNTGTPLVNGASQTGASLITDGWTNSITGILKKGDIFTVAGVNGVNPETGQDTGKLQQFVATADVDSGASTGPATIPISPPITTSGALKTVTASPADNAALTVVGTGATAYPINMVHHRDAFILGTADLMMPQGVDMAARENYDGISMRIVRAYDINTDNMPCRIDVLYGWLTARPEYATRVIG